MKVKHQIKTLGQYGFYIVEPEKYHISYVQNTVSR